ncbi:MAG: Smr/MutS family protein [Spirochaetia bacterium]|jgi:DNA-nicking Smr family endonuclease|nr:Smr/MutS family protein [Spirochaetia bacterium]
MSKKQKNKRADASIGKTAGNGRLSILTDDTDTFRPFSALDKTQNSFQNKQKKKTEVHDVKPQQKKKSEQVVETFASDITFADIFDSWENGRELKNIRHRSRGKDAKVKSSEVVGTQDFGSILSAWEKTGKVPQPGTVSAVSAERQGKAKQKASTYVPTKNFGEILSEFEGEGKAAVQTYDETDGTPRKEGYVSAPMKNEKAAHIAVPQGKKEEPLLTTEGETVTWSAGGARISVRKPDDKTVLPELSEKKKVKSQVYTPSKPFGQILSDYQGKKHQQEDKNVSVGQDFSDIYRLWTKDKHEDACQEKAEQISDGKIEKESSIRELRMLMPQAELDLHGETADIAGLKTHEFLARSKASGLRKISIITGKGLHNDTGKSVLREIVLSEIRLSGLVREAYTPKERYGGSGAIWVILKAK